MLSKASLNEVSAKEVHALVLLIQEMLSQIDEVALLKRKHGTAKLSSALLKEMCSVLHELDPQQTDAYLYLLVLNASNRVAPRSLEIDREHAEYAIPSKHKLISHIREELSIRAA